MITEIFEKESSRLKNKLLVDFVKFPFYTPFIQKALKTQCQRVLIGCKCSPDWKGEIEWSGLSYQILVREISKPQSKATVSPTIKAAVLIPAQNMAFAHRNTYNFSLERIKPLQSRVAVNLTARIGYSIHFVRILTLFHVTYLENVIWSTIKDGKGLKEVLKESLAVIHRQL